MARRRRHMRRNSPLTDGQISALRGILAAHGSACAPAAAKTNPKRKARRHGKKRRISASLRRILLKNLRKARAAKARKHHRRSRR